MTVGIGTVADQNRRARYKLSCSGALGKMILEKGDSIPISGTIYFLLSTISPCPVLLLALSR
jgi:hypothetical protein